MIAAVRRYMRFLQFKISDSYIAALTTVNESEEEMDDILEVGTPRPNQDDRHALQRPKPHSWARGGQLG